MKHFINLKDIPSKDLRKILDDAKKKKIRKAKYYWEWSQGSFKREAINSNVWKAKFKNKIKFLFSN